MIFDLKLITILYGPENPAAAQQVSSAMINSMRQHKQNTSDGSGGEEGGGHQGGDEPWVGGAFDSSQIPTPWPGQMDQDKAGLGGNPLPNNFDGPRDPGMLPAIVELENANPLKDITGGAFDSVMHAFNEAINWGKASILRFISGTKMVGYLLGSFFRGFLKLFKEFRHYFFVIGSNVVSEFHQMMSRWFNISLGDDKEKEEEKSASMKDHADDEQHRLHGEQRQMHSETEGKKQVDELLTPENREALNRLHVNHASDGETGRLSSPHGRYNESGHKIYSPEEFDEEHPLRPRRRDLRQKNKQFVVGHHTYVN